MIRVRTYIVALAGRGFSAGRRLIACRTGMAAVEAAFVLPPLVMMLFGFFQFMLYQYTQVTLNNALYETAGKPELEALTSDKDGYKAKLCAKVFNVGDYCRKNVKVELAPLAVYPTAKTPIQGTIFLSGIAGDMLLLRATLPVVQIVPFIPAMSSKSSVVFIRP